MDVPVSFSFFTSNLNIAAMHYTGSNTVNASLSDATGQQLWSGQIQGYPSGDVQGEPGPWSGFEAIKVSRFRGATFASPIQLLANQAYQITLRSTGGSHIGSPKMYFFTATDLTPTGPTQLNRDLTADLQVGMRPEHLYMTDTANAIVEGKLELVENLGEYALVHLTTASNIEFIAKTEKPPEVPKGSTIGFNIKPGLAHFFDASSGARME